MNKTDRMHFLKTYGRRLATAVLGTLLFAAGVNLFIVPISLYSGGFLGIGMVLRTLLVDYAHIPIPANVDIAGILLYIINVPLLVLAYKKLGKRFFVDTLVCVTFQTVFLTLIPIPTVPILTDKLAASIVGGVIAGYGCGMTLQNGGCGGGQDILGLYFMQKDRNFSVGKISMMINIAVFTACALMYDLSTVIYSLIYVAVYNFVTDYTHAQNRNVAAIIITSREDVMPAIRASIDRTATSWEGTGSFAGKKHQILYMVMSQYEAMELCHILKETDPGAFVTFLNVSGILGNFDKHL